MRELDEYEQSCINKCPQHMQISNECLHGFTDVEFDIYVNACMMAACAGSGNWSHSWHDVNNELIKIGWKWIKTDEHSSKIVR